MTMVNGLRESQQKNYKDQVQEIPMNLLIQEHHILKHLQRKKANKGSEKIKFIKILHLQL